MSPPSRTDRELLETLMIDVAVIKDKIPVLDRINDHLSNLKSECLRRHDDLNQAARQTQAKHEARFAGLETAQQVAKAVSQAQASWSAKRKALFWSGVVAVSTAAQVVATVLIYIFKSF
jgi:hypothetical protein